MKSKAKGVSLMKETLNGVREIFMQNQKGANTT
jgi:hypothetical protein